MASKLSFDISLNSSEYVTGAKEAQKANSGMKSSTEEYLKSFGSLKKELRLAKTEALNLSGAFQQLSNTEKESEIGKQMAAEMELAIKKAAELEDIFSDTQQRIKREASDTQGWDAMKDAIDIGKDLATTYAGAVARLTGNEKAYKDMIANIALIQGGLNAAIKIGNALQKQSNIMIAIGNLQLKAKAAAEALSTKNTVAATIAQRAFNAAANANPYMLIATLAITAATAIGGYMLATKKSNEEDKESVKLKEKLAEAQKAYSNTYSSTLSSLIVKYRTLQNQWNRLSTEQEKNKWIKENTKNFSDLGLEIKNVVDAENVFVKNTRFVIDSLVRIAKAAAARKKAEELYSQAFEIDDEIIRKNEEYLEKLTNAKAIPAKPRYDRYGRDIGTPGKSREEVQAEIMKQRDEEILDLKLRKNQLENGAADILQKEVGFEKNLVNEETKSNNETKTKLTHLQKLENEVKKYKTLLEDLDTEAPDFEIKKNEIQEALKKAEENVKNYKIKVGIEIPKEEINKEAEKVKKEIEKELQDIKDIDIKLNKNERKDYDFSFLPEGFQKTADEALNRLNKLIDAREDYAEVIEKTQHQEVRNEAIKRLEETEDEYNKLINTIEKFNEISSKIGDNQKKYQSFRDTLSDISSVAGSIDSVVGSIENLVNAFSEGANGWEIFMGVISTGISIMEGVCTVMEIINTLQDLQNAKKTLGNSELVKEGVARQMNVLAQSEEIGTTTGLMAEQAAAIPVTIALATAVKKLAAAQIFAAHAAIPFIGVGIATGMVASMEAVLAAITAFEKGGIVGGNSFSGDKVLIRANSGERVLTQKQNKRLEEIVNSVNGKGITAGNTVHVIGKISGKDLLLVEKNYNSYAKKAGKQISIF